MYYEYMMYSGNSKVSISSLIYKGCSQVIKGYDRELPTVYVSYLEYSLYRGTLVTNEGLE